MGSLLKIALRWVVILLLLPGIAGIAQVMIHSLPQAIQQPKIWIALILIVAGFLLHRLFSRGRGRLAKLTSFLDTFEHEMTHAFVGLLFFRPPSTLHVTDGSGGHIKLEKSNWAIELAPYLLPFWTGVVALLGVIVQAQWSRYFFFAALLLYGVFLSRLKKEIHPKQTDLRNHGWIQSLLVIALFHLFLLPLAFSLALHTLDWRTLVAGFFTFYPMLFEALRNAVD